MMLRLLHPHSACDKRKMTRKWSWKKRIWKWLEPLSSNMVTVRSLCSTQNQGCGCRIRFVYLLPCSSATAFNSWEQLCPSQHFTTEYNCIKSTHTKYNWILAQCFFNWTTSVPVYKQIMSQLPWKNNGNIKIVLWVRLSDWSIIVTMKSLAFAFQVIKFM